MDGWLKLYRKIMDSPVFNDPDMYRLWSLCLFKASYTERDVAVGRQIMKLQPGEFVTGRDSLESEYNRNMKPSKRVSAITLWRMLKTLEEWGKLNINSTNKYSIVSIVNWSFYQQDEQQNDQQLISERSANDQQVITNKKERKRKVKKENQLQFGQFVKMTQDEYDKLVGELSKERVDELIDRINDGIAMKGYKYTDFVAVVRGWHKRDKNPMTTKPKNDFASLIAYAEEEDARSDQK